MYKTVLAGLLLAFLIGSDLAAQTSDSFFGKEETKAVYNYSETFKWPFYRSNGSEYRSASGKPGPLYWQNRADYKIDVSLDEAKNEITGTTVITYTNNSPDALEFLWLQLDQNIFKPESRGSAIIPLSGSRNGAAGQVFESGYKIQTVKLLDGSSERELSYLIDDTRLQVFLPSPLQAKAQSLKLKIEYSFIVPSYGSDRMGILDSKNGKIFNIAQWYPRMCVYDDVLGWNITPYTGPSEFYLEYGDFDIAISVPASHIVVCSGELLNPDEVYTEKQRQLWEEAGGSDKTVSIRSAREVKDVASRPQGKERLTWRFRIENARDAAWASSSAFVLDAARINLPGGKKALAISAYPGESDGKSSWGRSTEYVKAAIEFYSEKWMVYPYPTAINVAGNISGMEYPGIVFCKWKDRSKSLWEVTDHEFGHTWFPMIVGSNERLHGWMDEGLCTFINYFGSEHFNKGEYADSRPDMHRWARILTGPQIEPVVSSPDNMKESNIAYLLYYKPAMGLLMLRDEILGPERFDRAFKAYIERWSYKHPTPDDFFRTIENVAGEDLSWFWRGWFLNNWKLDQAITEVKYNKGDPRKGLLVTIDNLEKMAMPVILEVKSKNGNRSRIKLPVEIWKRNTSWTFLYPSTEEIASVTIDPDHVFPDSNSDNNRWNVKD